MELPHSPGPDLFEVLPVWGSGPRSAAPRKSLDQAPSAECSKLSDYCFAFRLVALHWSFELRGTADSLDASYWCYELIGSGGPLAVLCWFYELPATDGAFVAACWAYELLGTSPMQRWQK